MALKWHPDNIDEADKVFKIVAEAYEALSDCEVVSTAYQWVGSPQLHHCQIYVPFFRTLL